MKKNSENNNVMNQVVALAIFNTYKLTIAQAMTTKRYATARQRHNETVLHQIAEEICEDLMWGSYSEYYDEVLKIVYGCLCNCDYNCK